MQIPEAKLDSVLQISEGFLDLSTSFPDKCFYKGKTSQKLIALTFDDGPTELSKQVVAILDQYQAKGTFFWLGNNLSTEAEFIKEVKGKHQLANHSWDHSNGWKSSCEDVWENQVLKTNNEFKRLTIPAPTFYRPPFGSITKQQAKYISEKNINIILWSISTLDWDTTQNTSDEIFDRFKSNIHPSAIVLLHDRTFNDDGEQMLAALIKILKYGNAKGYQFVTVNDLLK